MQFRDESIAAEEVSSADDASDESRMWYVRLRIRDDRLAKLWVWKLAEHDVIVWSEADERWKKLLVVPELRTAVRKATASAYARKAAPSEAPPKADPAKTRRRMESLADEDASPTTTRRKLESLEDSDFDEQPTQARLPLHKTSGRAVEQAPTRARPRTASVPPPRPTNPFLQALPQRPVSVPPPRPVDPFLHALTTSIPPAVHSTPAPEIPRAPRLPSFNDLSAASRAAPVPPHVPAPRVLTLIQPQQVRTASRVASRAVSQFSIRNISWAMVPIACAGVFAMYLDRNPIGYEPSSVATRQSAAPIRAAGMLGDYDLTGERFAALIRSSMPVCSGQPSTSESSNVISPEQLATISNGSNRYSSPWRTVKPTLGAYVGSRKVGDKGSAQSTGAGSGAAAGADSNEFDKDGARTALKFAIARVRNCSNSGVSGSALITFATSGTVQRVQLSQLVGDDVDPSCVTRALSGARVPPYTGSAVTVRKAF
jgi:hypothetical protein